MYETIQSSHPTAVFASLFHTFPRHVLERLTNFLKIHYIRFLSCHLFGPVNHDRLGKVGREVVKKLDYQ
jgi:hypothetical protein